MFKINNKNTRMNFVLVFVLLTLNTLQTFFSDSIFLVSLFLFIVFIVEQVNVR